MISLDLYNQACDCSEARYVLADRYEELGHLEIATVLRADTPWYALSDDARSAVA